MCRVYTLDVIVEGAVSLSVLFQEAEGIVVTKVLELYECVLTVFIHHRLHELINQVIILL